MILIAFEDFGLRHPDHQAAIINRLNGKLVMSDEKSVKFPERERVQ